MSGSTITSSGTLTYSSSVFTYTYGSTSGAVTWPITINAGVTVTFGSDLTLTTTDQYFIISGANVTVNGAGYEVDFTSITPTGSYTGFIDGGSQTNSTVQNIGCINNSPASTNLIISYISRGSFTATSSISNCYVICDGNITSTGGGITGASNSASISKCYVICGGSANCGIAGATNTGTISNCYVICGGNINTTGGVVGATNSGTISSCYVICGGSISSTSAVNVGGIAGLTNSASISNCYVICAVTIRGGGGGIAAGSNSGPISNCYVICCSDISGGGTGDAGGIAGATNSGTITSCYVNYNTLGTSTTNGYAIAPSGTITTCVSLQSTTPNWTSTGAAYLTSSAWTDISSDTNLKPWLLSAFNTAIASSTTASSTSGSIALNTYGQAFLNGDVYSGTQTATFTYVAGTEIDYSSISTGTYTLGLYANDLLSELSFTFTFTNDTKIRGAFNYTGTSANSIVPYEYSVTDDVTLDYTPATITSSGTFTYSGGLFYYSGTYTGDINTWPITINTDVTVTFGSDLTLTTTDQYFIIGGSSVTIDGAGYQVDFSGISTSSAAYNGFIDGGSQANSTVQNIGCIGSATNQIISYISRGSFTASSSISNCYVICSGGISGGSIVGGNNSAPISNCYVICGENISSGGGIAGSNNSADISNCYVICGGNINTIGGVVGSNNSADISNCYVICGGDITTEFLGGGGAGGIAGGSNSGQISNCYVICCGDIVGYIDSAGGIAGQSNSGTITSCYVNYNTLGTNGYAIAPSGTITTCVSLQSTTPNWTSTGAAYLTSSAWTDISSDTNLKPWLLSAFNTAVASSTIASSTSGSIALNTYGQAFLNGDVYSGTQTATFTYNAGSNIAYSNVSDGTTYTLGLYGYQLLSNLTSFTFTNDTAVKTAFNYTGTSANTIVPYEYSVTDDVTLDVVIPATITGSGTFTYSGGLFYYSGTYSENINTWPITINAGVTVTFGSDLTLTTTDQYFIIGGSGVTIDGAGYQVDFSGISTSSAAYNGFIDGGSQANSTVQNIGCIGSGTNQIISYISRGSFTASSSISNCYVICGGDITSGIAGQLNSAPISNCYVICGGNITSGIAGATNSAPISNCYVICGGDITSIGGAGGAGGIAGNYNESTGTISNCYVICGGDITPSLLFSGIGGIGGIGGIAGGNNSASISSCYVICCGDINNATSGGIAGNSNTGTISSCYVNYKTLLDGGSAISPSGTITNCGSLQSIIPHWTSAGAAYLTSSAWITPDPTNYTPWLLRSYDTAIASSTTTKTTSGTILLNTYSQIFANGSVYSGTQTATFTYVPEVAIAYSDISSGTYTLGLYAYNLLSNITSFTFAFTNETDIRAAFNYNGTSANNIVPYEYSVTNNVSLTYTVISNVCFQEKTPIKTDQGVIPIEKINPERHTINYKKIVAITRTISEDTYLVCFEKNSLGTNCPSIDTVVSKQHKIRYKGKMFEAYKLVDYFDNVKKVKYDGEILYNILMEKHEIISVNNLLCETLHPKNIIAKLHNVIYGEDYKDSVTKIINESILNKDYESYKKVVSRL